MDNTTDPSAPQNASTTYPAHKPDNLVLHDTEPATLTRAPAKVIDWKLVKDLYLEARPLAEISTVTGASVSAIRCRAWRGKWRSEVQRIIDAEPLKPAEIVSEWTSMACLVLMQRAKWWLETELEPRSLREAREADSALEVHINTGRKLLGLDQQANSSAWATASTKVIDV